MLSQHRKLIYGFATLAAFTLATSLVLEWLIPDWLDKHPIVTNLISSVVATCAGLAFLGVFVAWLVTRQSRRVLLKQSRHIQADFYMMLRSAPPQLWASLPSETSDRICRMVEEQAEALSAQDGFALESGDLKGYVCREPYFHHPPTDGQQFWLSAAFVINAGRSLEKASQPSPGPEVAHARLKADQEVRIAILGGDGGYRQTALAIIDYVLKLYNDPGFAYSLLEARKAQGLRFRP